ncbi:MAG: nucleotidyltransferase domain-containing protein [Deltaproteobacteria bacterium]|nr:nucleotidyltransferase domain-containing protein [Deltaproteobacteria bacterium]
MIHIKSSTAKKILGYFFLHENESLFVNEMARFFKEDKRNLVRKLNEFETLGLFKIESRGNLKIYSLNKKFPLYKEYRNLVFKTLGIEVELRNILKQIAGIKRAFIYGSYAGNKFDDLSDIDLMVIGEHNIIDLQKEIAKLQKKIGREINLVNMDEEEIKSKKKDPFMVQVMKGRKIELL